MKSILFVLLSSLALSTHAAEFTLNGNTFKSEVFTEEVKCSNFSILYQEERFPYEVEDLVPEDIKLKGFSGSDIILGANAIIRKGEQQIPVPIALEPHKQNGTLSNDNRTYLPGIGYCDGDNKFMLTIWSGGHCETCERLLKYQINADNSISEQGVANKAEVLQIRGW